MATMGSEVFQQTSWEELRCNLARTRGFVVYFKVQVILPLFVYSGPGLRNRESCVSYPI